VNRILERLEGRLAPVVQPEPLRATPVSARGADTKPSVVSAPVAVITQGTIMKYLVMSWEDGTVSRRTPRKSGAQPTQLEQALGPDGPDTPPRDVRTPRGHSPERVDWGGASGNHGPPTRPAVNAQPSGQSDTDDTSDDNDINRESGAQPTQLEETSGAIGPDTQPGDVSTPQGDGPERFDWRVDLRDNTYKCERLIEPGGPAEHTRG